MALKFLNDAYFAAKVGIGTESPETALHVVSGGIGVQGTSGSAALTAPGIWMGGDGTSALIYGREGSTWKPAYLDSSALYINAQSGGNVGIGTASPTSNLDIFSTGTSTLTLSYDGGGGTGSTIDFSLIHAGVSQPITTQIKAIDDGAYRQNLSFLTKTSATGASALSTRMIILATGNVGIATTSPSEKLHIAGGGSGNIRLDSGGTYYGTNVQAISSAGLKIGNDDFSGYAYFHNDGNVGIGTTSPSVALQLGNSTLGQTKLAIFNSEGGGEVGLTIKSRTNRASLLVSDNDTGVYISAEGGKGSFGRTQGVSTANINIDGSGNVGIGTTSPGTKLQVSGDAYVTGQFGQGVAIADKIATYGAEFRAPGASAQIFFGRSGSGVGSGAIGADSTYVFRVWTIPGFGNPFVIKQDGNVGIGTTSPGSKLTVNGSFSADTGSFSNELTLSSNLRLQNNITILNKAQSAYISFATRNTTGSEVVMDLTNVGSINGGAAGPYLPLAGGTMTAGAVVTFLDSSGSTDDRLKFGSGGDMQLFHDGTASHIVSSGSDLRIDVPNFIVRSAGGTESIIRATQNAAVELYYNNSKKFETTSAGVTVTGDADVSSTVLVGGNNSIFAENNLRFKSAGAAFIDHNTVSQSIKFRLSNSSSLDVTPLEITPSYMVSSVDMYFGDNDKIRLGAGSDLQIYHDGSNSYIKDSGTGDLVINSNLLAIQNAAATETMAKFFENGSVDLYYDDSKKLSTGAVGVGTATTAGGTLIDGWITTTQANAINNTTIATTAYVNNKIALIPAGLRFEGTWDASTGNPPSASPENGQFWIVSVAGNTNLSGITDWKVGDWAIYVVAGSGTDGWQKVDNSSVLDGSGTGGTVAAWAGSGTSNTLTNSPITFSGNNVSFAGNGTFAGGVTTGTSLTVGTTALVNDTLYLAEYIQHIGNTSNNIRFTTDAISISANATFAGDVLVEDNLYLTDAGTVRGKIQLNSSDRDDLDIKAVSLGSNMKFFTVNTEKMRITSAGTLIVGGTTARSSSVPTRFSVQGGMSEFETSLTNNNDWENSPISILERANIGSGSTDDKYSPNLNFHWSTKVSNSLWMGANGNLNYGSYTSAGIPAVDGTFAAGNLVVASLITANQGAFTGQVTGPTPTTTTSFANKAYVDAHGGGTGPFLPLSAGSTKPLSGVLYAGQGVKFTGGTIASATTVLHTNNVIYSRGGSGGMFLQNADGSDGMFIANDHVRIETGSSERMRINSSGDVLMGNTVVNPASNFSNQKGFGYKFSTGQTEIATTSDVSALTLGRNLSADGSILELRKESTIIGLFGSNTTGGQPLLDISANTTNGNMRFLTAGSERIRITSSGNVGIGRTPSTAKLEVAGEARVYTGSNLGYWGVDSGNSYVYFGTNTSGYGLSFQTAGAEKMRISSSGNVGIGTTSPGGKLTVADGETSGVSKTALEFIPQDASNRNIIFSYDRVSSVYRDLNIDANDVRFNNGGTEKMRITSAGNVGINTTTPFEKLQANGNIYAENRIISADATNANQNLLTQADIKISNQNDIYGNLTKIIISPYEAAYTSDGTGGSTIRLDSENAMAPGAIHTFSVYYKNLVGSISIDLYDVAASGSYTSATGTTSAPASGRLYGYAQKASTGAGAAYNFVDINLTNNGSVTLLNPKLETGKVVTEFIATTEDEGIPQTITTNNLRATGSIQMGADDTTATTDKVGTMRYRTGTEYVDVDGTNLISNPDFTTDTVWTKETGWTITGGELVATAAAGNTACYQSPGLTNGSIYRCTFTISEYTSGKVSFRAGTAATNTFFDAVGTYSVIMTAGGTLQGRFGLESGVTTTLKISQCSIVEVVAEDASYADMCMQTGASTYEWVNIVRNTY